MHLFITFKQLPNSSADGELTFPGDSLQTQLKDILGSMVVTSGSFADMPGGFVLVDLDSAKDLTELLSSQLTDNYVVDVTRILAIENLAGPLSTWS